MKATLARRLVIETYIPQPCTRGPRGVPGQVIAMRQSDGRTIWKKPIASESSPLVVGGLVYVGSWDHRLYALGLGTGKIVWSVLLDGEVDSSAAFANGTVYVGDQSGTLTALNARTGAIRWKARSFSHFRTGREYFYATPTVAYGRVFASNTDGTVYAFGAGEDSDEPLLSGKTLVDGHPAVYICERFACQAPITSPAALGE